MSANVTRRFRRWDLGVSLAWAVLATGALATSAETRPVEITVSGSHHHVLAHWLRVAEAGGLPREGVTVVHLDGHPDLAVPKGPLAPGWPDDIGRLVRRLDIASFQLAAVRVGLVDRIVWLRPAFADQLPDGTRRFQLGEIASGELRVDDSSNYYVLDRGWSPGSTLADPAVVALRVVPVLAAGHAGPLAEGPTILDIDLDAFATRNPAAERLRGGGLSEAQLDALRGFFAPESLDLAADPQERIAQVDGLLIAVEQVATGPWTTWPGALFTLWRLGLSPLDLYELQEILTSLRGAPALDELLEDGRELVGLPEHVEVSAAGIDAMAGVLREMLTSGSVQPSLVTIARSVDDGFTPSDTWPQVEWAVLRVLAETLPGARLRFDTGLRPAPHPGGPRPPGHP